MANLERLYVNEVLGSKDGLGFARPPRFTDGLNNLAASHPLFALGIPAPYVYHTYFNDFDSFGNMNADATDSTDWDFSITEAGAGEAAAALIDGDGGLLLLTNDAADDDRIFIAKKGESFLFATSKPLFFEARFKVSDATQSDFLMGLMITDSTPLDVTDGVYFQKDDGDAFLDFHVEKNNTSSDATALATVVSDTFLKVQFFYNGVNKVFYGTDDVVRGSLAVTNLCDDEELAITFGIQNGEAVAKTMTIDYIFCAKLR